MQSGISTVLPFLQKYYAQLSLNSATSLFGANPSVTSSSKGSAFNAVAKTPRCVIFDIYHLYKLHVVMCCISFWKNKYLLHIEICIKYSLILMKSGFFEFWFFLRHFLFGIFFQCTRWSIIDSAVGFFESIWNKLWSVGFIARFNTKSRNEITDMECDC